MADRGMEVSAITIPLNLLSRLVQQPLQITDVVSRDLKFIFEHLIEATDNSTVPTITSPRNAARDFLSSRRC